jgi:DNA-binding MarR family transcriptional regulator
MSGPATDRIRDLEAQMGVLARRIRRVVAERAAAIDPSLGHVGYSVFAHLGSTGACRQTDLVCALLTEKGAVSRAVQQLVDLGLASRVVDPDDARAQLVALTGLGEKRFAAGAEARRAAYAERLAGWTPDELDTFVALLARYNQTLEQRP